MCYNKSTENNGIKNHLRGSRVTRYYKKYCVIDWVRLGWALQMLHLFLNCCFMYIWSAYTTGYGNADQLNLIKINKI